MTHKLLEYLVRRHSKTAPPPLLRLRVLILAGRDLLLDGGFSLVGENGGDGLDRGLFVCVFCC